MTVQVFPLLGKQSKLQMSAPVGSASFDDHIQTKEFLILHMYVVRTMSVSILCCFFIWDRIFESFPPLGVSVWFKRLPAMCCVLAGWVESE